MESYIYFIPDTGTGKQTIPLYRTYQPFYTGLYHTARNEVTSNDECTPGTKISASHSDKGSGDPPLYKRKRRRTGRYAE